MDIDIAKMLARGEEEGEFRYDYAPPEDICLVPLCRLENVRVSGKFYILNEGCVRVELKLEYRLAGNCSFCLEETAEDITWENEIYFVDEQSDEDYMFDGRRIKMDSAVNEELLLSQPGVLLCEKDRQPSDEDDSTEY
ncbi:MAG: DUF177 domain-containing protein [Clostridia bacterium]|nr:DUF177 domain-containing protein [Clostridia bacterium]